MKFITGVKYQIIAYILIDYFCGLYNNIRIMAPGQKKGGKKGIKKRTIDPLTRKEWFNLKAPVPFKSESFGYTCANKTAGLKKVEDAVRGRVVTYLQADLSQQNTDYLWRKVKLIVDQVAGKDARTSFYGLDTTRDELCFSIKKWRTMIEAVCDVKTNDGYVLRVFTIAFTRKIERQKRNTAYALSSQVKLIRKKIVEIINKEVNKSNVTQVLEAFTSEVVHEKITKEIKKIYPVENIKVRKIKVIQRPKIDSTKLNEMHDNEKRNKAIARQIKKGKNARDGKNVAVTVNKEEPEAQNLLTA